ncbi:MAG: hypothetical protein J5518_11095 [Lachnospiraceae bacterium]|nr:hypothetical protein [Lachnospiraceae bacterium]
MLTTILQGCLQVTSKTPGVSAAKPAETEQSLEEHPDIDSGIVRDETAALQTEESRRKPLLSKHAKLTLQDSGWDVFVPSMAGRPDYRFNPSVMLQEDGSVDAWFSAPGDGYREYDYITYKHSEDGGQTWSDEKVVLSPTPGSPDALSTCDPDVFWYDGYYYLGYSSTINKKEKGLCNSTFLARAKNPDGPYEKWNGSGWGGLPAPLLYFDGVEIGWGCGEPSFVVVEDTLYIYTTKDSYSSAPERVRLTEVHSVKITGDMWPADIAYRGCAVDRSDTKKQESPDTYIYQDADSWDVAYAEETGKFIAVGTNRRFLNNSCLLYYESNDGVHFDRVSELNTDVICRCHNCGIMSDRFGHIGKDDPVIVSYAYSGSNHRAWGVWGTRFASADLTWTDEPDRSEDGLDNLKAPMNCRSGVGSISPQMLKTDRLVYQRTVGGEAFTIQQYLRDGYHGGHVISREEITFQNYDEEVVEIDDENRILPKKEGVTSVIVKYGDFSREITLCVLPENGGNKEVTSFYRMTPGYQIPVDTPFIVQVRPMAVCSDFTIHELRGEEILKIGLTFISTDPDVCEIGPDGAMHPMKPGLTDIVIETDAGLSETIPVHII